MNLMDFNMTLFLRVALLLSVLLSGGAQSQSLSVPLSPEARNLLQAFYDYEPQIPLEARVVERKEERTSVREKVIFRGVRGALVPGYLELPQSGEGPFPCVLLMHGWSGAKDRWWRDGGYIHGGETRKALLEAGFAVFALDAQAHGDRIAENDYAVVNDYNPPGAPPRKNYFTLRDIITQTIRDYRRGIDYLETRPDIDVKRLGIVGYSMGGFHAVSLTSVEPRIKAAVGCVVPVSWREDPILDPANYVAGIGERPFLLLQGKTDGLCNEEQAKALYTHFNPESARLILYDSGHKLPAAWVADATPWLTERL